MLTNPTTSLPVTRNVQPVTGQQAIIAHIDMDCFFCSVEEKHNPSLKGTPVIVGGTSIRGVVSASNYKAREFGVFSAMSGTKAKDLCPKGNFLPVNMPLYKKESKEVMKVLQSFTNQLVQVSVDEAYLDLTELSKKFFNLEKLGEYIQSEVHKKTGLTCSIGIAKCKTTAKIASDFKKPNGVTIVNNQKEFLSPLDVKKMPGIGKKSISKYYKKGIKTMGDLAKADAFTLMDIGGKHAVEYQKIANGTKQTKPKDHEEQKSISLEKTFSFNQLNKNKLLDVMDIMSEKIHIKLNGDTFKTISIKLRDEKFKTITRDHSLQSPTKSLKKLKETVHDLMNKAYKEGILVRLIGVKVTNLNEKKQAQKTLGDF